MDAESKPGGDDASQSSQSETNFAARLSAEQSEMLGKFLLAPVPRGEIPPEIRRAAGKGRLGIDGWLGLLMGTLLMLASFGGIFVSAPSVLNDRKLEREHREVTGVITNVRTTYHARTRGSGDYYQYEYAFGFIPEGSTSMKSGYYHTTDERQNAEKWHAGDKVQIWYLPDNAAVARIKGTRLSDTDIRGFLFIIAGGCVLIWWNTIRPRRRLKWMLANGMVDEFRVTNVEPITYKKQTLRYRVECRRIDDKTDDGCYRAMLFQTEKVGFTHSGRTMFGLYDPRERERGKKRRRLEIPETWFW